MRVGLIQAGSQSGKNPVLERYLREAVPVGFEVMNFGVFPVGSGEISYVAAAVAAAILLGSGMIRCC